jgi:hypothetical protein
MDWAAPRYSKPQVDVAGRTVADRSASAEARALAVAVVDNWRASHSFPLNTIQVGLRQKAKQVDKGSIVAQRIKRLSSIEGKLARFPSMNLSRMQDLGGCRGVVSTVDQVNALREMYRRSNQKHRLVREDDYIACPKESGYRGVHLVYRYFSDRKTTYNGMLIEMQLRTQLQHTWATAVETAGTFIQQALKSSQGEAEWLRFFRLMGTSIALREKCAPVPGTAPDMGGIREEVRRIEAELKVVSRLTAFGRALTWMEEPEIRRLRAHFYILELNVPARTIELRAYRASESERAAMEYAAIERTLPDRPGVDAVLVSVESAAALRRAYPNYFLDTTAFVEEVRKVLAQPVQRGRPHGG